MISAGSREQFLPSGDKRGAVFARRGRHRGQLSGSLRQATIKLLLSDPNQFFNMIRLSVENAGRGVMRSRKPLLSSRVGKLCKYLYFYFDDTSSFLYLLVCSVHWCGVSQETGAFGCRKKDDVWAHVISPGVDGCTELGK